MDALKRAEEAKRQGAGEPGSSLSLQLEPTASAPTGGERISPLPDLDSHLDKVEADLKATAAEQLARATAKRPDPLAERAIAQTLIAQESERGAAADGNRRRIFLLLGAGVLAGMGVAGYFYWQLTGIAGSNRLAATATPAIPRPTTPPVTTAAPSTQVSTPLPATAASPSPPGTASSNAAVNPPRQTAARATTPSTGRATPRLVKASPAVSAPTTATSAPSSAGATGTADPSGAPLAIQQKTKSAPIQRAYAAMQAGRYDEARNAYREVLRLEPRNIDALLGLAALARRDGDNASASDYYEQVLRLDPRHPAAHTGLVALYGALDPAQAESRLNALLGPSVQNSDTVAASAVHFALGNLYAGQQRWREAQQAFFKAHTADDGNPDILFNLGVALEHLKQGPLARQFYERALRASQQRGFGFDRTQAEQRVAALTR